LIKLTVQLLAFEDLSYNYSIIIILIGQKTMQVIQAFF